MPHFNNHRWANAKYVAVRLVPLSPILSIPTTDIGIYLEQVPAKSHENSMSDILDMIQRNGRCMFNGSYENAYFIVGKTTSLPARILVIKH